MLIGEGVKANGFLDSADIEDVMPTLLYALGFPIARDLDGRVLTSAFDTSFLARHPLTFVPSYETLATQEPLKESKRPGLLEDVEEVPAGEADP